MPVLAKHLCTESSKTEGNVGPSKQVVSIVQVYAGFWYLICTGNFQGIDLADSSCPLLSEHFRELARACSSKSAELTYNTVPLTLHTRPRISKHLQVLKTVGDLTDSLALHTLWSVNSQEKRQMLAATAASSASAAALAQGELGWSPMGYTVWTEGPANPRAVMATAMLWLRSIRLANRRAISRIAICGPP